MRLPSFTPAVAWFVAASALVVLAGCGGAEGAGGTADSGSGQVGELAPEYAAPTLEGDSVSLASLRGAPVLLNVWATWCPPCREEIPELQALHEELGPQGLEVVGVTIDNAGMAAAIRSFAEEQGMTYRILHDSTERISDALRLQGVPATLLIDREGRVAWRHLGPVTGDDPALREALAGVLGQ